MKFDQLIEYNKRNIFTQKIMQKMRQGDYFQTHFYFFKNALCDLKTSGLGFNLF